MVYSLKGYKTLSVTQLVNIFVVVIHNLKSFEAFRLLCCYLYLEAKQEATERSLKQQGYPSKAWEGPSTAELRSILGGRKSLQALWNELSDLKLISKQGKIVTITQTPLPEARPFLGLISGLDEHGGFVRSIIRPVPVPHEWLLEWSQSTRSKLVPLLHLFYCAACLAFKSKRSSKVSNAATFKLETFIYYTGLHRSRWKLARKNLIDQKRVKPDATKYQRKLNRDGHYAQVLLDWCRESKQQVVHETGPPVDQKCNSVGRPYRDKKLATLVVRNQKRSGVFSKQNRAVPNLNNVKRSDLWDIRRLEILFEQQRWIEKTLPNFQFFVAAAVKARSAGRKPGSLFVWLIREKKCDYVTLAHEDIALKVISEYRENTEGSSSISSEESGSCIVDETWDTSDPGEIAASRQFIREELKKLGAKHAA